MKRKLEVVHVFSPSKWDDLERDIIQKFDHSISVQGIMPYNRDWVGFILSLPFSPLPLKDKLKKMGKVLVSFLLFF